MRISDWSSACALPISIQGLQLLQDLEVARRRRALLEVGGLLHTRGDAAACEGPERPDLVGGSPPLALPGLDLGRGDGGIAPGKRELFLLRPVGLQLVARSLPEIGRASCRERVCQYV